MVVGLEDSSKAINLEILGVIIKFKIANHVLSAIGKLKQENCCELEGTLSYI